MTILEAIAKAGGHRERAVMIGDTGADAGGAVAAGIPAILVTYGYSHVDIRAIKAEVHVDTVAELRDAVMRFVAAGHRDLRKRVYR